jgi:hypothetical protein
MQRILAFLPILALLSSGALADHQWLPPAKEVFTPLRADPRELQYSAALQVPVGHRVLGEASLGDYFGLYRYYVEPDMPFQVSVGGGAFGRFNLASVTNDLESADFYANLPFDIRKGPWSSRFMIYHTSSHLGDDYIRDTGNTGEKHSFDNVKWLLSYDLKRRWRFYGGGNYVFRTLPKADRGAVQGGIEVQSAWHGNALFYFANDLQSWQRNEWNPAFNSEAGVTFANSPDSIRSVTFFTHFATGPQPQGVFYLQKETSWSFGVRFNVS